MVHRHIGQTFLDHPGLIGAVHDQFTFVVYGLVVKDVDDTAEKSEIDRGSRFDGLEYLQTSLITLILQVLIIDLENDVTFADLAGLLRGAILDDLPDAEVGHIVALTNEEAESAILSLGYRDDRDLLLLARRLGAGFATGLAVERGSGRQRWRSDA